MPLGSVFHKTKLSGIRSMIGKLPRKCFTNVGMATRNSEVILKNHKKFDGTYNV